MKVKCVGIVGYGQFGSFVHTLLQNFLPAVEVRIFDISDENSHDLSEVAQSDVVCLCVPIAVYQEMLQTIAPLLGNQTVLVDVATVKEVTSKWCQTYLGTQPYVCTHPMFGPASYQKKSKDISGLRLVVTDRNIPQSDWQAVEEWLKSLGLICIEMTSQEHDKYLAETLFLTHFIAQVVTEAKFVRTQIDTVSFGFLLDAVESVREDRALFKDVYRHNPYCIPVLKSLALAEQRVKEELES